MVLGLPNHGFYKVLEAAPESLKELHLSHNRISTLNAFKIVEAGHSRDNRYTLWCRLENQCGSALDGRELWEKMEGGGSFVGSGDMEFFQNGASRDGSESG